MKLAGAVASMVLVLAMMAMAASAVDITGFTSSSGCDGNVADTFPAHPDGACAPFSLADAGSVLFTGLTKCKEGLVFDVDCANIVNRRVGPPSSICFVGGGFTAAKWQTVVGCVE